MYTVGRINGYQQKHKVICVGMVCAAGYWSDSLNRLTDVDQLKVFLMIMFFVISVRNCTYHIITLVKGGIRLSLTY